MNEMVKPSCALGRAALAAVLTLSMVPSAALAQVESGAAESENGGGSAESPLLSDADESSADESPRTIEAVLRLCDEQGDLAGLAKAEWLCGWVVENCVYDAAAEAADVEAMLELGRVSLEDCAALCKELLEAAGFEVELDADGDLTVPIEGQLYLVQVSLEDESAGLEQQEDRAFLIALEEVSDASRMEEPAEVGDSVAPPELSVNVGSTEKDANSSSAAPVLEPAVPGLSVYGASYRYGKPDGTYAKNEWVTVSGKRYYFQSDGTAAMWSHRIGGHWYYFDGRCQMQTGWLTWNDDGSKSYFGPDGRALTGLQRIGGSTYYFDPSTGRSKRWVVRLGSDTYYFDGAYRMHTGWLTWNDDGSKSYFGPDGRALTGLQRIGGSTYYFDRSTARSRKWVVYEGGDMYYFNGSGRMVTGWLTWNDDKSKSYFGADGKAVRGWQKLGGDTYYFSPSTARSVKWVQVISGSHYYFDGNGRMHTGWLKWNADASISVYASDGKMVQQGWAKSGGATYYISPTSHRAVKWSQVIDGATYYFDGNGRMHTGWLQWNADKKWSYFYSSGKMATGTKTIDGRTYTFDANGKTSQSPQQTRQSLALAVDRASNAKSVTTFGEAKSSAVALQSIKSAVTSIQNSGCYVSFIMIDLTTGAGVAYDPNRTIYGASCVKGPYVASICRSNPGSVSGSVTSLMNSTVVYSDNNTYQSLRSRFGSGCFSSFSSYSGANLRDKSAWPNFTPKELAKLWVGNYWYFFKETNSKSSFCRNLFTHPNKSFIHPVVSSTTYTKAGWGTFPKSGKIYNDAGIVMAGGRPYVVAIMSSGFFQDGKLRTLAKAIDAYHASMF
ncbi:N-acetylmuramoyl-L-alanine amidase family protein [Parvibacter caecicola]|uniref:N-acetylmuramoyl-L-alanine amidase family protein n=2 Tax=Parvibacter caecicola TaxID=747645 RepID=A0A4T9TEY6_9ACTN|nr:N-acetylmuramoyl-L-alanine amidase family protein [Parvibacter caecicola]